MIANTDAIQVLTGYSRHVRFHNASKIKLYSYFLRHLRYTTPYNVSFRETSINHIDQNNTIGLPTVSFSKCDCKTLINQERMLRIASPFTVSPCCTEPASQMCTHFIAVRWTQHVVK